MHPLASRLPSSPQEVRAEPFEKVKDGTAFRVRAPLRSYEFRAPSPEEASDWISKINTAAQAAPTKAGGASATAAARAAAAATAAATSAAFSGTSYPYDGDAAGGGINASGAGAGMNRLSVCSTISEAETGSSSRSGPRISSAAGTPITNSRDSARGENPKGGGKWNLWKKIATGTGQSPPTAPEPGVPGASGWTLEPRWPGGRLQPQDSWSDISAGVDEPQPAFSPSARWSGGIGGHAHAQGSSGFEEMAAEEAFGQDQAHAAKVAADL